MKRLLQAMEDEKRSLAATRAKSSPANKTQKPHKPSQQPNGDNGIGFSIIVRVVIVILETFFQS